MYTYVYIHYIEVFVKMVDLFLCVHAELHPLAADVPTAINLL